MNIPKHFSLALTIGILSACGAGSGEGLDANGQPLTNNQNEPPRVNDTVTLDQLQTELFTPICARCHIGSNAPQGLRLDSVENSFNSLVGVDSNQIPSIKRVTPGNPEESYIIHKVEGRADIVGSRMPLNLTALSNEEINLIRNWISAGAQQSQAANSPTKVSFVESEIGVTKASIRVHFGRALNPDDLQKEDISITHKYHDLSIKTGATNIHLENNLLHIETEFDDELLTPDALTIWLNHSSTRPLEDINGHYIDGSNDNTNGGVFRYELHND